MLYRFYRLKVPICIPSLFTVMSIAMFNYYKQNDDFTISICRLVNIFVILKHTCREIKCKTYVLISHACKINQHTLPLALAWVADRMLGVKWATHIYLAWAFSTTSSLPDAFTCMRGLIKGIRPLSLKKRHECFLFLNSIFLQDMPLATLHT